MADGILSGTMAHVDRPNMFGGLVDHHFQVLMVKLVRTKKPLIKKDSG